MACYNRAMLTVYPTERSSGILQFEDRAYPCALGDAGIRKTKREGDGGTPIGTFKLRRAFFRADRISQPTSHLPLRALTPKDGWCDDPGHPDYNRLVGLPFDGSHEILWRYDGLYDVIIVIGHNDDPPRAPLGSAIFVHCAAANYTATKGCVAVARATLIDLLPRLTRDMVLQVTESRD